MKKTLLSISFLMAFVFFFTPAKAQRAGYGIRGAINFTNLNDTDLNTNTHTGLLLGLYFDAPVIDHLFVIQPEILYTQKGFDIGNDPYRIDYVEVPVLARVNFVNPTGLTPFVYAGPYLGIKVNTDFPEQRVETPAPLPPIAENGSDQVKTVDFGVSVGGGVDFGHLDLGVRYEAGLTDVFDNFGDAKNSVFSIVAGIGF